MKWWWEDDERVSNEAKSIVITSLKFTVTLLLFNDNIKLLEYFFFLLFSYNVTWNRGSAESGSWKTDLMMMVMTLVHLIETFDKCIDKWWWFPLDSLLYFLGLILLEIKSSNTCLTLYISDLYSVSMNFQSEIIYLIKGKPMGGNYSFNNFQTSQSL